MADELDQLLSSGAEFLEFGEDLPRRFVDRSDPETRAAWFRVFDSLAYQKTLRSIPPVMAEPSAPVPVEESKRALDPVKAVLLGLSSVLLIAAGLVPLLGVAGALVMIALAWRVWSTPQDPGALRFLSIALLGLAPLSAFLGIAEANADDSEGSGRTTGLVLIGVALLAWLVLELTLTIKSRNEAGARQREYDGRVQYFRDAVDRYHQTQRQRADIAQRLRAFVVDCLSPQRMAAERLSLMDELLQRAFAELNVSDAEAAEIVASPGQRFLEIVGPYVPDPCEYERPIVQVDLGIRSAGLRDTPILLNLLSYQYIAKVAVVTEQGLGILTGILNSVDHSVVVRSHDLLLWKSISRVSRFNAEADGDEEGDQIVLETFGGSNTALLVNGRLAVEYVETVQAVTIPGQEESGARPSAREVNAFIREVQRRMTS